MTNFTSTNLKPSGIASLEFMVIRVVFFVILSMAVIDIRAQSLKKDIEPTISRAEQLLKSNKKKAYDLADSILKVSQEINWSVGIISSRHVIGKYYRRLGEYDTATQIFQNNINLIQDQLHLLQEDELPFVYRNYGVSYYELAVINYYRGQYDEAFDYSLAADSIHNSFFKGLKEHQKNYKNSLRVSKMLRANVFYVKGEIDKSIKLFEETIESHLESENYYNASVSLNNVGTLYKDKGDLRKAMDSFQKALQLAQNDSFPSLITNSLGAIGQLYYSMKEHEQALEYSQKAYYSAIKNENKFHIAFHASDVADNLLKLNRKDSASWYYNRSLSLHEEMANLDDQAYVLQRIAALLSEDNKCDRALDYINRGLALTDSVDLPEERLLLTVTKASCLLQLNRLQLSLSAINKGIEMANSTENISHKKDVYDIAHKVYSRNGLRAQAYQYLQQYLQFRDSIYTEEKTLEVAKVQYQFALEKQQRAAEVERERNLIAQQRQVERQQWILYSVIVGGLLSLIIGILVYRLYLIKKRDNVLLTYKNETIEAKNEELSAKNEELSALREKDLENRERERRLLQETIYLKERELAGTAMINHEKNTTLSTISERLNQISELAGQEFKKDIITLKKLVTSNINSDDSWDSFIHQFERVHPQFFHRLKDVYSSLTVNDLKLCAYIKVGMDNKEIAQASNLALSTVKKNINRLKKKMELKPEDSIRDFLIQFT